MALSIQVIPDEVRPGNKQFVTVKMLVPLIPGSRDVAEISVKVPVEKQDDDALAKSRAHAFLEQAVRDLSS